MSHSNKIILHRNTVFSNIKAKYKNTPKNYNEIYNSIVSSSIGNNKFFTEFSYMTNEFVRKDNVSKCLGWQDDEFNVQSLNNDPLSRLRLTHPNDIEHKVRYDRITYSLLSSNYSFSPLEDYYKLTFRMLHKDGSVLKIERSVFLFRVNENNIPISQLSMWEVSRHRIDFVKAEYFTGNFEKLIRDFYRMNCEIIGLRLTPAETKILKMRYEKMSNESISDLCNCSLRTVEKHIENIKSKCKSSIQNLRVEYKLKRTSDVIFFLRKYGLFPFQS